MTILVATDGSDSSVAAAHAAGALHAVAGTPDAAVVVVHAFHEGLLSIIDMPLPAEVAKRRLEDEIEAALSAARSPLSTRGIDVVDVVDDGPAAEVILRTARERGATTIAIGRRGLNATQRLFMGSVSARVLHHADCEVILTPEGAALASDRWPERILVGTDGSPAAVAAAQRAAQIAKARGSGVRLVTAATFPWQYTTSAAAAGLDLQKYLDHAAEAALAPARAVLAEADVASGESIFYGQPADSILDAAGDWQADLIVLGRRGLGAVARFLLGSVSHRVATHADVAVLVVPPAPAG
jgi:nucleotide-binding universal stress UspA family protein